MTSSIFRKLKQDDGSTPAKPRSKKRKAAAETGEGSEATPKAKKGRGKKKNVVAEKDGMLTVSLVFMIDGANYGKVLRLLRATLP